jgi:hypothetical protein
MADELTDRLPAIIRTVQGKTWRGPAMAGKSGAVAYLFGDSGIFSAPADDPGAEVDPKESPAWVLKQAWSDMDENEIEYWVAIAECIEQGITSWFDLPEEDDEER